MVLIGPIHRSALVRPRVWTRRSHRLDSGEWSAGSAAHVPSDLKRLEEVLVQLHQGGYIVGLDAYPVRVGQRLAGESARCDENAPVCLLSMKRTTKACIVGRPIVRSLSYLFCLDVDTVESERVLADDAVDAGVSGSGSRFDLSGRPVLHRSQEPQHKSLECDRCEPHDPIEELTSQSPVHGSDGACDDLLRGSVQVSCVDRRVLRAAKAAFSSLGSALASLPESLKLNRTGRYPVGDGSVGCLTELSASLRDLCDSALRPTDSSGRHEVADRPPGSVHIDGLAALDDGGPVIIGELHPLSHHFGQPTEMLGTVLIENLERWSHHGLVCGHCHGVISATLEIEADSAGQPPVLLSTAHPRVARPPPPYATEPRLVGART